VVTCLAWHLNIVTSWFTNQPSKESIHKSTYKCLKRAFINGWLKTCPLRTSNILCKGKKKIKIKSIRKSLLKTRPNFYYTKAHNHMKCNNIGTRKLAQWNTMVLAPKNSFLGKECFHLFLH